MGYAGQTYTVPCNRGGFNHSPNYSAIPPESMIHPSRNINMHRGGRESRGGTSKVNASAGYGGVRIMGAYDYTNAAGTQQTVVVTADGKIWKDATTTIKTGWGTGKRASFAVMNNLLYICNGYDRPQTWNGTDAATADLAAIPTDWTGINWPKQLLVHGAGNSERMWAIMPAGKKTLYASKDNNGVAIADFADANVLTFNLETGDYVGLTGMFEFGDRLFVLGKRIAFVIQDTDTNTANWGYTKAQWEGGVANHFLIVQTPNDIVCMMDEGEIYSISAVQSYGDYKQASIARPAYIDAWMREYLALTQLDNAHAIYNPKLRCIDFFMAYSTDANTTNNMALRYFIDRGPTEGWMPQDNQDAVSGYRASCSFLFKVTEGDYQVRTGDYSGFIWSLESSAKSDDGEAFYSGFKTAYMDLGDARLSKHFFKGWVIYVPQGIWSLSINIYIDGRYKGVQTIPLGGDGTPLDSFILDTSILSWEDIISTSCPEGYIGKRIAVECFTSEAGEPFFISSLQFDFKMLGARP